MTTAALRDPVTGTGKPEALKGLPGVWSRRVDQEHRLVYGVAVSEASDALGARCRRIDPHCRGCGAGRHSGGFNAAAGRA